MANYSQSIDFSAKDALATGNPSKKVLGSDIDTELGLIQTAIATKQDTSSSGSTLTSLAASAGASVVLIQSETASASATLDLALNLTDYARHIIHIEGLKPATDNVEFWGRVSSDDVTYATANYRWSRHNLTDSATEGLAGDTSDAQFLMANAVGNQDGEQVFGTIEIASVSGMGVRVSWRLSGENAAGSYYMINGMGAYVATASTYFRLLFSSGNITSGTVYLYGFKKA